MLQFKYHHVTESHDCDKGQSGITFDQLRTFVFQNSKDICFLHIILCELKMKGQIVKSLQKFWLNLKGLEKLAVGDIVLLLL